MFWGLKSRMHDIEDVIKLNPKSVEFHLTQEEVEKSNLNGNIYNIEYSIHLPEYWNQKLINICEIENFVFNTTVYTKCISKGLSLKNNFKDSGKLKIILHPGGMSIDKIEDRVLIQNYYNTLNSFVSYLYMIPEFKNKIEILVENMPPLPWFYGGQYYSSIFVDPDEIVKYCLWARSNICLDISHLGLYCNYKKKNLTEEIIKLEPFTKQIHLADASGTDGEGAAIGDGNINFEKVINQTKNIDCAVIPEVMWGHKNDFAEFKRTITICNQYLGGVICPI